MKKIKNKNPWIKTVAAILIAATVIISLTQITPGNIREIIAASGSYGEIVYLLMWLVLPIGFFPVSVLAAAGGVGFGIAKGSLLIFIGSSLNLIVMFYMARFFARDQVREYVSNKFPKLQKLLFENQSGLKMTLFLLRLSPVFPYGPINYGYGLTDMNVFTYYWVSLLGILPGIVVYANVGDKVLDVTSPEFIFALALLVVLGIITEMINRMMKRREEKNKKN